MLYVMPVTSLCGLRFVEDRLWLQPGLIRHRDQTSVLVGPFDRKDCLWHVDAVLRGEDKCEVWRLLVASIQVDRHQKLYAVLLWTVHWSDVLEIALGHSFSQLNGLFEGACHFRRALGLILFRESCAVVLNDVGEVVEVRVDQPAGLEDHLVHILEECGWFWFGIIAES